MKLLIALLGLACIVVACSSVSPAESTQTPVLESAPEPVGNAQIAQEMQEIEELEAALEEIEDLESELNLDGLEELDEELVLE